jgi:hypothetical protein
LLYLGAIMIEISDQARKRAHDMRELTDQFSRAGDIHEFQRLEGDVRKLRNSINTMPVADREHLEARVELLSDGVERRTDYERAAICVKTYAITFIFLAVLGIIRIAQNFYHDFHYNYGAPS